MDNILEVNNISKQYGQHQALDQVSLRLKKGHILGLLGPNGAGKTSLIRIITQIISADAGEIIFDGAPISRKDIAKIGYLPEERGLYKKMKVGEQLMYLSGLKGLSTTESQEKLRYWFERLKIDNWWNKKIEDLSKGMQQKIQFIATVLHQPKLLILDEPFSGFDPVNAKIIKNEILLLKEQGTSIIFSTHRMESVEELCDDIVLIHQSKVQLEGTKKSISDPFRNSTFIIKTTTNWHNKTDWMTTLSVHQELEEYTESTIQLAPSKTTNDLLSHIIQQTEVIAFKEVIPSINDIFIQTVSR